MACTSIIGRFLAAFIGERIGYARAYHLYLVICFTNAVAWIFCLTFDHLVIIASVHGYVTGGILSLSSLLCSELFGKEYAPWVMAASTLFMGPGAATGATISATIHDISGKWTSAKVFTVLTIALSSIPAYIIVDLERRKRKQEENVIASEPADDEGDLLPEGVGSSYVGSSKKRHPW